jgi:hypothetical protein
LLPPEVEFFDLIEWLTNLYPRGLPLAPCAMSTSCSATSLLRARNDTDMRPALLALGGFATMKSDFMGLVFITA